MCEAVDGQRQGAVQFGGVAFDGARVAVAQGRAERRQVEFNRLERGFQRFRRPGVGEGVGVQRDHARLSAGGPTAILSRC